MRNASSSPQGSHEHLVILAMLELSEDRTLVAVVVDSKLDAKFSSSEGATGFDEVSKFCRLMYVWRSLELSPKSNFFINLPLPKQMQMAIIRAAIAPTEEYDNMLEW